jgi:recombination protein RecT
MNEPQQPKKISDLKPVTKAEFEAMPPKKQVAHLIQSRMTELAKLTPPGCDLERISKVATIAATTTPGLLKCDVPSLVAAVGHCVSLGLEPNTPLGLAYLVPFNTKRKNPRTGVDEWVNSVQVIIGYRGYIELARRSGQIISIAAHEVRERDRFDYSYGLTERLEHVPAKNNRGEIIAFYAVARLVGGGYVFEVMSREDVETIRDGSQGWQNAVKFKKDKAHPWHKHFVEMGRKTAIRRIAKYLPLSLAMATAMQHDGPLDPSRMLNDPKTIDGEFQWLPDDAAGAFNDAPEQGDAPPSEGEQGDGDGDGAPIDSATDPTTGETTPPAAARPALTDDASPPLDFPDVPQPDTEEAARQYKRSKGG